MKATVPRMSIQVYQRVLASLACDRTENLTDPLVQSRRRDGEVVADDALDATVYEGGYARSLRRLVRHLGSVGTDPFRQAGVGNALTLDHAQAVFFSQQPAPLPQGVLLTPQDHAEHVLCLGDVETHRHIDPIGAHCLDEHAFVRESDFGGCATDTNGRLAQQFYVQP